MTLEHKFSELQHNNILYNDVKLKQKYNHLDIIDSEYLYKFVDTLLKKSLSHLKYDNKKPFKITRERGTVIVQYPSCYNLKYYNKWYKNIEKIINTTFYRKESENDDIPDLYQRKRLFTIVDSKEIEIDGNIVIKSIPVYRPKRTAKKTNVSKENKELIKQINGTGENKRANHSVMFYAEDSDSE